MGMAHSDYCLQNTCPSHTGDVPSSMVSSLIPNRFRIIAETLKLGPELYRGEQGMFEKKKTNNPTGNLSSINVVVRSLALCSFFPCLPSYTSTVIKKKRKLTNALVSVWSLFQFLTVQINHLFGHREILTYTS